METGVIVKDKKMPSCCDECFAFRDDGDYPYCIITDETRGYNFRSREKRMDKCPLVEVRSVTFLSDIFSVGEVKRVIELGGKLYFRGDVVKSFSWEENGVTKTMYTEDGLREIREAKRVINLAGYPESISQIYNAFDVAKKYIGNDASLSDILKWASNNE